jgi:hypothetical protein
MEARQLLHSRIFAGSHTGDRISTCYLIMHDHYCDLELGTLRATADQRRTAAPNALVARRRLKALHRHSANDF